MRIHNSFLVAVMFALAALTAFGSIYTAPYQQASQSESTGFDALAHDLFGGLASPDQAEDAAK